MAPIATVFVLAVAGGLSANAGLMQLNKMHKGCANVCTLCQFLYGLTSTLLSPKRRFLQSGANRKIPVTYHCLFAAMFFVGPYLGNKSVAITNADFYPVFLVVRSCGSVTSMILGWWISSKRYSLRQVISVCVVTVGAVITTFGCYAAKNTGGAEAGETTPTPVFLKGLVLLLLNLLNDAGLSVLQSRVFEIHGKHVDECVVMMSAVGTLLMALTAGPEVLAFLGVWVLTPTTVALPLLAFSVPLELGLLVVNFYGNWNAKKLCTWLNANSTAVISSLVPMMYRLLSTFISTQMNSTLELPGYTWFGIALVFVGSLSYLLAPKAGAPSKKAVVTAVTEKKAD